MKLLNRLGNIVTYIIIGGLALVLIGGILGALYNLLFE